MKAADLETLYGEIVFTNGDISINNNANYILAECLMVTAPGEFRKTPTTGFDISSYLNTSITPINQQFFKNKLKIALTNDGFSINELIVEYSQKLQDYFIKINGERTK